MTLRLGQLVLPSPFMLAPMESVTDAAFRRLCWEQGAAFTWTEMIRGRGIAGNNRSTLELIDTHESDVPTGVQLLVASETELKATLEELDLLAATSHPHLQNIRGVDLNFGCPSPAVIRAGLGPALLKRRGKLKSLFQALATWRRSTAIPVGAIGAKIRLGLNRQEQDQKVYLPIIELANETLDYVVVHARHARQESTSPPTWEAVAELKARAAIPVFANGDIFSLEDWLRVKRETGADGAMIARAAIKSHWVFRALSGQGKSEPNSLGEVDSAEANYNALAERLGSKDKFRAWHREGFERMRRRLRGLQ